MEKIQSHEIRCSLLSLLFLLYFLLLQLPSSAYTLPDKYFINCGSENNITAPRRTFTGDLNPGTSGSLTFTRQSRDVKDSKYSTSTPSLYQTARIFSHESSYEFVIGSAGIYLVRLHFYAFSSPDNLSTARFGVSASGFSVLDNFSVPNASTSPIIKEYLLSISIGKFPIYFIPRDSSFAFVNAIELFLAPESFIPAVAPHVSPAGSNSNDITIVSKALQTVHRINVGGSTLTPENDTLWRYWVPDDTYLYNPDTAKNSKFYSSRPSYQQGASEYIAPDLVYQTAKEMNIDSSRPSNNFNITWSFNVSKGAMHFVRIHFCDIVSPSPGALLSFNLYIYGNFSLEINPFEKMGQLAAPFYFDFVVDSDQDSGVMNISIGPTRGSVNKTAFLNGLEIMEIVGEFSSIGRTSDPKKAHIAFVVVGSVIGFLALICILAVVLWLGLRCRKAKPVETLDWLPAPVHRGSTRGRVPEGEIGPASPNLNLGLKISFAEIQFATNNFDEKMRIGKGGFGIVFRGTLRNGTKVAVKRSNPGSRQGLPEFQTEIIVLSKIRHRHLVSLIGYCDERSEMILVYEFMEKGTLRDHLYNSALPSLSWKQRLEICIGAAKGLHYLHRGSSGGFIHRDVKSTNILLDENYVAKVADFGLSRLSGPCDHVSTGVKGTFGYLDPDYFRTEQLSEKSDVYSFGVVLLEVLCARPALDALLPLEQANLADWAMFCKNKGTFEQMVDPSIKGEVNPNSQRKFVETAEKCLQEYGVDRPDMGDVLWDLEYAFQLQQTGRPRQPHEDSTTDGSAMLALPNIRHLPSFDISLDRDDMPILRENDSNSLASEVFSQMKIDDAR